MSQTSDSPAEIYFQFVLCLVIILLCGKDGMPGLQTSILCAISEICPDAKVRQQWKGTSSSYYLSSYLSTACIWTYVRMPKNLQCSFAVYALPNVFSKIDGRILPVQCNPTMCCTELKTFIFLAPVTVCILPFLLFIKKRWDIYVTSSRSTLLLI